MGTAKYIDQAAVVAASITGGPIPLTLDDVQGISFHCVWDGDLTAALTVEASNDPKVGTDINAGTSTADWEDITALLTVTDPAGSAGNTVINMSFGNYGWVRLVQTFSSATSGGFEVYISYAKR